MLRQIIIYLFLLNFCLLKLAAQEFVTGLQSNKIITDAKHTSKLSSYTKSSDTIDIPFFDDFSGHSVFPDRNKWSDEFVFINNSYSNSQITTGVATFDALDNFGRLYETASSSVFQADKLTSLPINLNYSASDNIWLSFFYQPGGLADPPEIGDTLVLQLYAPDEDKWYSVWKAGGDTVRRFRPAILKIENQRYLKKGFKFRFLNYATLSQNLSDPSMVGNSDIWNIDYIMLDRNRDAADTIFADVAFRFPVRSLLKSHEAMPWKQFRQVYLQEMGSSIAINYRNNDIITRNITRNFQIWDVHSNSLAYSFTAGATNIDALTNIEYNANLVYTFNTSNSDSALFKITCSLKTDAFDPKENDTVVYYQVFNNYFAFDDGSSEGGYGINGLGSRNAMVASKFTSFLTDTLRAVQICFNDSYLNANKRAFDLMVWSDNNGIPGDMLYSREEVMVEQGDIINGFYNYIIPDGVEVDGPFYVGWRQRSETFLNAGYDINTPHINRQFYWLNGQWSQSQVEGSIMIRPIVGDRIKTTSVNDQNKWNARLIKIWPNPASDYINIDIGELQVNGLTYISVFDISGREMIKIPFSESIDISILHKGIYIIVTTTNGKPVGYNRLIKSR